MGLGAEVDPEEIARMAAGFCGAELANLINEGALLTVRAGERTISRTTLEGALGRAAAHLKLSLMMRGRRLGVAEDLREASALAWRM